MLTQTFSIWQLSLSFYFQGFVFYEERRINVRSVTADCRKTKEGSARMDSPKKKKRRQYWTSYPNKKVCQTVMSGTLFSLSSSHNCFRSYLINSGKCTCALSAVFVPYAQLRHYGNERRCDYITWNESRPEVENIFCHSILLFSFAFCHFVKVGC